MKLLRCLLVLIGFVCASSRADETSILAETDARILHNRTALLTIQVVDQNGTPVTNATVNLRHLQHLFHFGAAYHQQFPVNGQPAGEIEQRLQSHFLDLFNYATVTFYWGPYEGTEGQPDEASRLATIQWMNAHHIDVRGHPIFWNHPSIVPSWVNQKATNYEVLIHLMDVRLAGLSQNILPKMVDADVFNELAEWQRNTNAFNILGPSNMNATVVRYLKEMKRQNPNTKTVVNDYVVDERYSQLLKSLIDAGGPIDIIGQQCHMHAGNWSAQKTWDILERQAKLNRPIVFSELSVLSGPERKNLDWVNSEKDWNSDPAHEQEQADYMEQFYKLIYSHPASVGIVIWDFTDRGAWLGAPVGILRKDGTPKPSFDRLDQLINHKWRTNGKFTTDANGFITVPNAFEGRYEIQSGSASMTSEHSPARPLKATLRVAKP